MISIRDNLIEMHTKNTSYVLYTGRGGLCECLHYGGRIKLNEALPLLAKVDAGWGGDVKRDEKLPALSALRLELSPYGRGDYRRGAVLAEMPHGGYTAEFTFSTAQVLGGAAPSGGMPGGRKPDEVLALSFSEAAGLEVELFYSLFYDADVITKKMRITNRGSGKANIKRCLSSQLDLPRADFELGSLCGAWAREGHLQRRVVARGTLLFGNNTGASGNRCNPFFFLAENGANENSGEVYGFNLVYSGSHEYSVEVDEFGRTRVMQGVCSEAFCWPLAPGESIITPEAVLTYSDDGLHGMSRNMHTFVREHILPPQWAHTPRPVLVNNWEGTYFKFSESKIMAMARVAAKLGAELFVLDDGWFGARNSDKAGLGDYDVNTKKLPSGIKGLAERINDLGLKFGLWFEPEMVNEDSKLYRAHPNWAVATPSVKPAKGRNQFVLDLCQSEVREYIIKQVGAILDSANISYVKWDMNRHISDAHSPGIENGGQFMHSYILGLYQILDAICAVRDDILFEGCSSGGNRYDLGMLYYMPQTWISDDSDAYERQKIQTGFSYAYPLCTMGCHVSAVPNHQTLRKTSLDTRFNTAMFGLLGYELDLTQVNQRQKADIKRQIAMYKKYRTLLQYGDFYRLVNPFDTDACRWIVVADDKSEALVGDFIGLLVPNSMQPPMRLAGLSGEKEYKIAVRAQKIDIESFGGLINHVLPVHVNPQGFLVKTAGKLYRMDSEKEQYTAYGDMLCKAGLARLQEFSGAGYSDNLRFTSDFDSRAYYLREV